MRICLEKLIFQHINKERSFFLFSIRRFTRGSSLSFRLWKIFKSTSLKQAISAGVSGSFSSGSNARTKFSSKFSSSIKILSIANAFNSIIGILISSLVANNIVICVRSLISVVVAVVAKRCAVAFCFRNGVRLENIVNSILCL